MKKLDLRAPWTWRLGIALVWAVEAFAVQEVTFAPVAQLDGLPWLLHSSLRLTIDLCAAGLLVLLLPTWVLLGTFLAHFAFANVVITHFVHVRHPLSLLVAWQNFGEGLAMAGALPQLVPGVALAGLGLALAAKAALAWKLRDAPMEALPRKRLAQGLALAFFVAVYGGLGLHAAAGPLEASTPARLGSTFGYVISGVKQSQTLDRRRVLLRALETERQKDLLTEEEAPFPVRDRIVLIQVESLDWGVLDFDVGGRPVTPYLRALRDRSAFYKLAAIHVHGSADADFAALNNKVPSPDNINYRIPDYPYDDALPRFLAPMGYRSSVFHGVSGDFFDRRPAFRRMGFDRLVFAEELERDHAYRALTKTKLFDSIVDAKVFDVARDAMRDELGKAMHFIITASSHVPFELELGPEYQLLPGRTLEERYFNSMAYVDDVLRGYVESLAEPTTVLIFGDHDTHVEYEGYDSGRRGVNEYVPLFLHDTRVDLAAMQATRERALAQGGYLNVIHVMTFLRARLADQAATELAALR